MVQVRDTSQGTQVKKHKSRNTSQSTQVKECIGRKGVFITNVMCGGNT